MAALAVGLTAAAPAAAAGGDRNASGPSLNSQAESSVKRASALKWLPYRPAADSAGQSPAADRVARTTAPASGGAALAKTAQWLPANPMSDPFGDSPRKVAVNAAKDAFGDAPLESPLRDAKPDAPPLDLLPTDEPAKLAPAELDQPSEKRDVQVPNPKVSSFSRNVDCPARTDTDFFTPIEKVTPDLKARPRPLKRRYEEGTSELNTKPEECKLEMDQPRDPHEVRPWPTTIFTWTASGLCHKPLYFEDVQLERYGHTVGPVLQPFLSGAHFFVSVPLLPYNMGLTPPGECMYTLGYYRPGSCAPYLLDPFPLSIRAALAEAGVATGLIFLIP